MSAITVSARGEECQIRLWLICNRDNTTTVLAHLNGAGWAIKKPDILGAYACSSCHDAVDGRLKTDITQDQLELEFRRAVERTQLILIDKKLILEK